MGSDDEFGPDTMAIRAWLAKRAEYAADRDRPLPSQPSEPSASEADEPSSPAAPMSPDVHEVGRSLLDQLREDAADSIVFDDEPEATPDAAPAPPPARPAPRQDYPTPPPRRVPPSAPSDSYSAPAYTSMPSEEDLPPAVIEFKPRTGDRRILGIVLLGALGLTALAAVFAVRQPTPGTIAVAAVLGLLVLVVWAVRTSATPTRLTVRRNQLEVVRRGERRLIDLASPYTPVAVVGRAGERGWQVLIEQLDGPLMTLTSRDVDPQPFLQVLHRLRPDLRDAANSAK